MRVRIRCMLWCCLFFHGSLAWAENPGEEPMSVECSRPAGQPPLIIAHRGASAHAPENTLAAFGRALDSGATLVELDYYHSVDGVPFVFHDDTTDRTTNALQLWGRRNLSIESLTYAQLQVLDAGSWFHRDFTGEGIPTLNESIDLIQEGAVTLIERKGGDAATLTNLLSDKNLLNGVVVQAFDWEFVAECHRLAPQLPLCCLGKERLTASRLDQIQATGAQVVGWKHSDGINQRAIASIHERGLSVWVYTVDDPERAQALADAGVDGIITNVPLQMHQLFSSE